MNLGTLINRVRVEILDDPINEKFPDDNLWSNDELTAFANWAEREACHRAKLLFDTSTADVAVFTLDTGDYSKALPAVVIFAERAWFDGSPLSTTDEDQLQRCYGPHWENRTGKPQAYYLRDNEVCLYPKPETGGELILRVCRYPLKDMGSYSDTPEISAPYHEGLLHGIAGRAYQKQDSQCLDKRAAADQISLFDGFFGKPVSVKNLQHQRNRVQKRAPFRTF